MTAVVMETRAVVAHLRSFFSRWGQGLGGDALVVGVSGGPDSTCLLHALWSAREERGLRLHVAHLNHGLRGREAEEEASFVAGLAEQLGLPCTVGQADVRAYRQEHRCSLEEAARQARYRFLAEVALEVGAPAVAVGHTRDDQAETVLLHLLRGTGLRGLRGMMPVAPYPLPQYRSDLTLLRPLLGVRRAATEAYCRAAGLSPCEDSSNRSREPLRNRVRLELLPLLHRYNPRIVEALAGLAETAGEELELLEGIVASSWNELAMVEGASVRLRLEDLRAQPLALRRRLLLRAVQELSLSAGGEGQGEVERVHLEGMIRALGQPTGTTLVLPRGLRFRKGYQEAILELGEAEANPWPLLAAEYLLAIPGVSRVSEWEVHAATFATGLPAPEPSAELRPKPWAELRPKPSPWRASFDAERLGERLWVRARRRGDRLVPLGMAQPKKLQDLLVDAKVPREWRDRVPLVVSPAGIQWVVGVHPAAQGCISPETRCILQMEFRRSDGAPLPPSGFTQGAKGEKRW